MSDLGEAMGTAAEGGLFARAISRRSQSGHTRAKGHFDESACLNCGTPLIGSHCHECGQAAHLHRTLGALWHDLAHGVLHLDGKTWRTLPLLAWKPGELTRRYIHGERAGFVSPMAMFLFSVFLMFAVFQAVGLTAPTEINTAEGFRQAATELSKDSIERRDRLEAKLEAMPADDPDRADTEADLQKVKEAVADLQTASRSIANSPGFTTNDFATGSAFLDHAVEKWNRNPGLMLYKLQSNSYKFSWLLIPLSLPFMWLLFAWKKGIRTYDHAIFVTYSIAFMSLLFIAASLMSVGGLSESVVGTIAIILPAIHLYRHLKSAYQLSRFSTLWRLTVLLVFISVILTAFLLILMLLGAV